MQRIGSALLLAALAALLAFAPLSVAGAQGGGQPPTYCNGLDVADCALLEGALANLQGLTSFASPRWLLTLNGASGADTFSLAANGSAAVELPATVAAILAEVPRLAANWDIRPLVFFLEQYRSIWVVDVLAQTSARLVVDHALIQTPGDTLGGSGEALFRDLALYRRLSAPTGTQAWFGDPLTPTPAELDQSDRDAREWAARLSDEEFRARLAALRDVRPQVESLQALVERHITTRRLADVTVDGQLSAVFSTELDFKALLAEPELPALLSAVLSSPAFHGRFPTVNPARATLAVQALNAALDASSLGVQIWVGFADAQIRRVGLDVNLALNARPWMDAGPFSLRGILVADLAGLNQTTLAGVTVPAVTYGMDARDRYLAGDARLIEGRLAPGEWVSGTVGERWDRRDVYALPLQAGQSVALRLFSTSYPWLRVYGPDGFEYGDLDGLSTAPIPLMPLQSGVYLIAVEAAWPVDYALMVTPTGSASG